MVNFLHTTIGRFCCKRLPYGIYSASEVFEKTISLIISDIQGSSLLVREKKKKKKKKRLKNSVFFNGDIFFHDADFNIITFYTDDIGFITIHLNRS